MVKKSSVDMVGLQRNNQFALSFLNQSQSTWRDWLFPLYPKGRKSVSMSLQTHQGWVQLQPDPNGGFEIDHGHVMTRATGLWMKGTLSPRSCRSDVAIARMLMGWRRWQVSTPRVWVYRVLAGLALGVLAGNHSQTLAVLAFALPSLVPSPMTPAGLYKFAERQGFVPPSLRTDASSQVASPILNPLGVDNET